MVDTDPAPEDTLEALDNLLGKCNLRQHIKCLLPFFYRFRNQMDINLGLSSRCYTMQQDNILVVKPILYFLERLLLRDTQGIQWSNLTRFGIQTSNLDLICFKNSFIL